MPPEYRKEVPPNEMGTGRGNGDLSPHEVDSGVRSGGLPPHEMNTGMGSGELYEAPAFTIERGPAELPGG